MAARRTQKERTALSERLMFEAAVGLLVEHGTKGTTLARIGERSGYSRGLVTHRFGSKAGLLAHVHDTVAAQWLDHVQSTVGDATGVEALERVVDALYTFIVDEPEELRAMYLLRYASIDPSAEYRANVAKVNRAHVRDLARWLEQGKTDGEVADDVDARLGAELLASLIDGILYRWLVNPEMPVEAVHTLLRREVGRAMRRPEIDAE